MTRTQKIYGFRLGTPFPKQRDRFGNGGFKVVRLIPLHYCGGMQGVACNGDMYTQILFNANNIRDLTH